MSLEPRRSSRSNKGQHSRLLEEFGIEVEDRKRSTGPENTSTTKRQHLDSIVDEGDDEYKDINPVKEQMNGDDDLDEEGEVKCLPCGTNKDNYDEDSDNGTMIECDSCKTWQHLKCMGYRSIKSVPKKYKCNECQESYVPPSDATKVLNPTLISEKPSEVDPSKKSIVKKSTSKISTTSTRHIVDVVKDNTRKRVAKALFDVFKKNLTSSFDLPQGYDKEKLSNKWAFDLEAAIFDWASKQTNKKYTDKSRSLMVSVKKPTVIKRILDDDLSFENIVNLSPEEIDEDLKKYADKVRQESIRRSVLTMDDNQGQRIRRTHKGEELVESTNNQLSEDVEVNIISRNIDHRRFKEDSPSSREIIVDNNTKPSYNYTHPDEDDEEYEQQDVADVEKNSDKEGSDQEKNSSKKNERHFEESDSSDDELDFILKDKKSPQASTSNDSSSKINAKTKINLDSNISTKPQLPPISSSNIWSGQLIFPEFASFRATGTFHTCTNFKKPVDINSVISYNRQIKVCKELLSRPEYSIEGRLDRSKADAYLNKIVATRDLFLIEIDRQDDQQYDFDKVSKYLLAKQKVGVLSGRPDFVKDSYIMPINCNDQEIPAYLSGLENLQGKSGLFAVYVVKKDYIPSGPGILKRSSSSQSHIPASIAKTNPNNDSKNSLDSILNKLGGGASKKVTVQSPVAPAQDNILANLSQEQLLFLSELVKQHPHVQQNPQALIQLLQNQGGLDNMPGYI